MLYWAVRYYSSGIITGYNRWDKDQIVFYRGLFNIPSYFVWYFASDKGNSNLEIGDMIEFMVFETPTKDGYNDPEYVNDFLVESVVFDVEKECFKITCVNYFWKILSTQRLIPSIEVGTKDNPANAFKTIEKLLEFAWRNKMRKAQVSANSLIKKNSSIKYSVISVNPEMSILDVIGKICGDNGWEWYLGVGGYGEQSATTRSRVHTIYIGEKIRVDERWAFPFNIEKEHCQRMENSSYITITTESIWCEPLLLYGKPIEGRIIWTKMYLNNAGCLMTLMIQKSNNNAPGGPFVLLTEDDFILTLDEGYARHIGFQKMLKDTRSFAILVGKMYGEIKDDNINKYETPKWSGDPKAEVRDLNLLSFETEYSGEAVPFTYLENVKLSTPFAGNGVGVLYPQVDGHKTLLAPDGEREMALLGPGYFGPKDAVPVRESEKDFRLQLPGGWCLYVKENGDTYLRIVDEDNQAVPLELGNGQLGIDLVNNNDDGKKEITIALDVSSLIDFVSGTDGILQMISQGSISLQAENGDIIALSANGTISLTGAGGVYDIQIKNNEITLGPKVIIEGDLQVQGTVEAKDFSVPMVIPSIKTKILMKLRPG